MNSSGEKSTVPETAGNWLVETALRAYMERFRDVFQDGKRIALYF